MQALFWIEAALLCALCLLPVGLALRGGASIRGRRDPALALHRAQLGALERDRADGMIGADEYGAGRLEVERRLLAADLEGKAGLCPDPPKAGAFGNRSMRIGFSRPRLERVQGGALALALIPPAAVGLYLVGGHPELPAQPERLRVAQAEGRVQQDEALIAALRQGLVRLRPDDPAARQGYLLLGQVEAARGHLGAAAAAWRVALARGFDPDVAMRAAEAQSRADGRVGPEAAALFRHALDAAPADAPWRRLAEQRLAQFEHP